MKEILFIDNTYHKFSEERLKYEIKQFNRFSKNNNISQNKVMIAHNIKQAKSIKHYLITTNELNKGDIVFTLEISDISRNDNNIKDFILSLYNKGIMYKSIYEFFNTENETDKILLIKCLDMISISNN